MERRKISSGSPFEAQIGYSRAVVAGNMIFVAGTTGYDYATMTISSDVAVQCEQAFQNIDWALKEANASLSDTVRVNYILADRDDWSACWPVTQRYLGNVRPAATMIVAGLQLANMLIEIEVTAQIGAGR